MPHAVRLLISLAAVAQQGGGWWLHSNVTNQTGADAGPRDESKRAQLREWVVSHANVGSDWAAWLTWPDAQGVPERMWSWDSGLCMVLDTAVSFIGWMLFGNSWPGVRTGCQRIFRLLALLLLCMGAHYLWALCWPVLSLISVVVMGVVWLVRAIVRKLGTLVYWAQQAAGGVPEASDAEFLGPGTGRIPETADLRAFKKVGGADKWILVRRGGHVAVFKAGSDSQTIRTPGLFVPVEPDTMRGDKEIVEACQGYDKIHLCRNLVCNEEGQHFKEYGVARDFDGERFHLKNAELGAAKAGRALWSWLWASPARPPKPLKEFGSESETEPAKACGAHRVAWADLAGDCSLATQPCRMPGTTFCDLLFEDRFDDLGRVDLCPQHALDYERRRRPQQCHHNGCAHVGILGESGDGVRRSESRALADARRLALLSLYKTIRRNLSYRHEVMTVKSEGGEPEKRVRGSSPGRTPRSSIQKNLAKLGLLDSPAKEHPLPVLEEFFNQYAEGRDAGLSEEDVRVSIAAERGQTLKEVTKELVRAAIVEQEKGQRGLTKFLKAWQKPSSTRGSSPASVARGSSAPSWDLVETSPLSCRQRRRERLVDCLPLHKFLRLEVELQGNTLSKVGAELFLNALRNGAFPIAESSGKSGRYPKMWDLPWWREILRRPDVQFVEFPMCAFGLGPPDGEGYYHHRTRLVFPRCEAFAAALSRCCPGVGAAHRHVPLAGARPGAAQSRCAEAGVYPQEFVRTVVSTLHQPLVAGGEDSRPQWPVAEETRAGSDECDVGPWAPHWASRAGGDVSGRSGWLHELDDDYVEGCEGTIGFAGDFPTGGWVVNGEDTRAGSAERYEAPTEEAKIAAQTYIELTGKGGPGCPEAWKRVCDGGARLVQEAGSVKLAAESLWAVREEKGLNNLKGVDDSRLDTVLHPDLLEYLRDVRRRGLAARFVGERKRCQAKVHPNGRRNLAQVYRQIWKDVCKLRVLVVPAGLEMGPVISSPFDAVDKMLPDRSIAPDKRIVHDQRVINEGTHKEWHPPSVQPRHEQIARLVLFAKCQLPGVEVLMSKKDVAGAFRLLWVDPRDAELFAGDLPWVPEEMEEGDRATGEGMTIVYLVSSFGFSGSPGEWTMWGKATEEFLRRHCPAKPRRDLAWAFESRILVDDNVLVEPLVGLRPWVASEVYELGVKTLLGDAAVNREKDLVEGPFRTFQTVWGLDMDTATEEIHLPERRILKGAHLLSDGAFEYGCKDLTVRAVQRFRGLATGWTVIVRGLKNELKAADRFLGGGGDGGAKVCPKLAVPGDAEECEQAWRDLWELFEESRWLCARPETWPTKFGASMRELLPIRERLALPGEWDAGTVFVSSDATKVMIAAIDWTSGSVMRMKAKAAAEWVQRCGEEDEVAIHVAEMLSFLAFACQVGESWQGKIVLYGGDNKIVKEWTVGRKAGTRVGRLLVRVINLLEMRFRFALVATWWRTFHNVHADLLTRCSDEEFDAIVKDKGWKVVDVTDALRQAMIDSERFGPCLLAWGAEDRRVLMQLKERRLKRAVPHTIAPKWSDFRAVELCGPDRVVKDFVEAAIAAGGQGRSSSWSGPVFPAEVVFASLPPDLHAKVILTASKTAIEGKAQLVIFEGPRQVCEFLTTEFGELAARRRKCMVAAPHGSVQGLFVANTSRGTLAPPMSAVLGDARSTSVSQWIYPDTILVDSGIPREPLLPLLKGHYWVKGERHVLMSTSGPLRWPLCENGKIQQCVVWEPRGPPGAVRLLTEAEVWLCQGRRPTAWDQLRGEGHEPGFLLREGSKATGGQTAAALVLMAGYSVSSDARAGGVWDSWDDANLAKVLEWLRRWKRGLLSRAAGQEDDRRAGGCEPRVHEGGRAGEKDGDAGSYIKKVTVWRWGDVLWLPASSSEDEAEDDPRRAGAPRGGTRRGKAEAAHGAAQVHIEPGPVRPFTGEVGAHVEEWVEDNLCGYLADSTAKQYAGIYSKWRAWSARQGWPTEFLDKSEPVEANENKLLGFLGYLGWLGNSVASLKQAVFAIKDGHKRGGQGDPTEKMHRLWMLLGALDKRAPKSPRRLGVTPGMLKWIAEEMGPHLAATAEERFDSIMVLAALNTAWFFMLRAKEYCESNGVDYAMIMRGVDLKIECDEKGEAFVTLQFRKTKTDQEAFGTCKTMYASGPATLPGIAPQRFGHGGEALKPLFRWANGQMLKRTQVQYVLQQAAAGVGLPPGRFMSHSLRIGGASALFQATGEIEVVKRTGRWSSSAVQRYLHDGETALKQAASKMASVEQRVHYT
ncbi:unnamed protein product [Symbiodinium sp. CCMP2592]|nr:unnamed protein product [Symbiodinium sp. CCMP2592]